MGNSPEKRFRDVQVNNSIRRKLRTVLPLLSLIVIVIVFGWLKLTGITLAGEAFCGMDEHVHSEDCHIRLVCTEVEDRLHTHAGTCWEQTLTCNLQETQGHTHGDDCIGRSLVCEEEHTHDETACYGDTVLCDLAECEPHAHGQDCYTQTLVCAPAEFGAHEHSDGCYEGDCGLKAHTHDERCYSDLSADLETAADWEVTLANIPNNLPAAERLVAVAQSQLGCGESLRNYVLDEAGERCGITRYGQWYGNPYGQWSAMFVSFCLRYAGLETVPISGGAETMRLQWESEGLLVPVEQDVPQNGDLLFLDKNGNGTADAVAVTVAAADGEATVIEGDLADVVAKTAYPLTKVVAVGSLQRAVAASLTERDRARVERVAALIAALPSEDTVTAQMDAMDPDSEEFEQWFTALSLQVRSVYVYYEDLSEELRALVGSTEKLDALAWIWQTAVMSNGTASIDVRQVNAVSSSTVSEVSLFCGGSPWEVTQDNFDYTWWDAYIIEKESGGYYVSQINSNVEEKLNLKASTEGGFILLVWHGHTDRVNLTDVAVGQWVSVEPADLLSKSAVSTTVPLGTVTFTQQPAESGDNTDINRDKLTIIPGADTSEYIEVNLYNYGANINELYQTDHQYPGFQQDGGVKSLSALKQYGFNFGNNITVDLDTIISNVTSNDPGTINQTTNNINSPISGAMYADLVDGYPALADGTSLAYLFSDNQYAAKQNSRNINGLFLHDEETGQYVFDSRSNHAQFNSGDDTFTLYKQIISTNFMMYPFGNFMPFNDIAAQATQTTTIDRAWFQKMAAKALYKYNEGYGDEYQTLYNVLTTFVSLMDTEYGAQNWDHTEALNAYFSLAGISFGQDDSYLENVYSIDFDEPTDFFFGMEMHMEFVQPKDGLTGPKGDQPMVYDFTGDDDVWIYVDGKLFLDLSGIHRHVGGEINFTEGKVYYFDLDVTTGMISTTPSKTLTFAQILGSTEGLNENGIFETFTSHTIDFYYMERGAGSGVCRMNFNLPLMQKNHIAVAKELVSEESLDGVLGDPDFFFQVWQEGGEALLIGPDREYTVYDDYGNDVRTGVTDENGIFAIKAGEMAVFEDIPADSGKYFVREILPSDICGQYDVVDVGGTVTTVSAYGDLIIGTEQFKGVDSPVKDMADGDNAFNFQNHVELEKLGSLKLTKKVENETTDGQFQFYVTFDGVPVPKGAAYTRMDADGTVTTAAVETAGVILLQHGQSACFDRILAGTRVCILESTDGYVATVSAENIVLAEEEDGFAGVIEVQADAVITVTNEPEGTRLTLEADKTLLYPDGSSHTYTFTLYQVLSETDHTVASGGVSQRRTVTLSDGTAQFDFVLRYPAGTDPGVYYYVIREEGVRPGSGMDTAFYLAEVTVADLDGTPTAQLTRLLKNGTDPESALSFANRVVRALTVSKTVEGEAASESQFQFSLWAVVDGVPLSGAYVCDDGTELTFENGTAPLYLTHGQTLTVLDLPFGTAWTVTETPVNKYFIQCGMAGETPAEGNTISGTLSEDQGVRFVNIGGYTLPSTGTPARILCMLCGAALMLSSLVYGIGLRRKRERRGS